MGIDNPVRLQFNIEKYLTVLNQVNTWVQKGRIAQVIGLTIESNGPRVSLGDLCEIRTGNFGHRVLAEVVGFRGSRTLLMPLGDLEGIGPGSEIVSLGKRLTVPVSDEMVGRVLNGLGEPIDDKGPLPIKNRYPVMNTPPNPLARQRITEALSVGVKAIDGLTTLGKGQRIGIFAGSGVGKSTMMGMISRNTSADINVIALIGERGREVREFIERDLGEEGLKRSIVVVATSDQPALVRIKGAFVATTIAEFFRDQGFDVLLLMDSITRFALAQREVGLAIGEPPATRGFTPSVFALLPKLLERAGTSSKGSITGLYTVLVEGDDMNEPVTDSVRGIVDGHVVLNRELAAMNRYPAIDVLQSISRLMIEVVSEDHLNLANRFRSIMAVYDDAKDLIDIGAYKGGSNPRIDEAIFYINRCHEFLNQAIYEKFNLEETVKQLKSALN
ncbi:MAG: flagellar protein export ATPase FliI [Chitinophagales bacterium]